MGAVTDYTFTSVIADHTITASYLPPGTIAGTVTGSEAHNNLLPNSLASFEDGSKGGTWIIGNAGMSNSSTWSYHGTKSLKVAFTSSPGDAPPTSIYSLVTPGTQYTLSATGKAVASTIKIGIRYDGTGGKTVYSNIIPAGTTGTMTVTATIPADATHCYLTVYPGSFTAGEAYVDAIKLEAGATATPFGLAGVTVTVYDGTTVMGSTTTNASGYYSVGNLPAGTYRVHFGGVPGYQSADNSSVDVSLNQTTISNAALTIDTYGITVTQGANGAIAPAGTAGVVSVTGLTDQAFTIDPDDGYYIVDVTVDNVSVGAVTDYTFTSVIADHTITASFAIDTYEITVTQGANGAIAPAGTAGVVSVTGLIDQAFTIDPDDGYYIVDVTVVDASVGAVTDYTFTTVIADHTITASFAIDTNVITVTQGANGAIAPAGTLGWQRHRPDRPGLHHRTP